MGCNITRPTGPNKRATKERQSRVEDIKNIIADGPVRHRGVVRQGVHAHLGITLHEHTTKNGAWSCVLELRLTKTQLESRV